MGMNVEIFKKFSVRGCTALFGHQVQNIVFCLNQKNLFTNPS